MASRNEKYVTKAHALRQELGLGYGRVDPVPVLRSMGVEVQRFPFPEGADFDGAYEYLEGVSFVLINTTRWPLRQRFTAAHELGHHVFDCPTDGKPFKVEDDDVDRVSDNPRHRDVNTFAGAFLIDPFGVKELSSQGFGGHELIAQVIARFEVSVQAAALELKALGYISQPVCDEAFGSTDTANFARTHGAVLTIQDPPALDLDQTYQERVLRGFVRGRLSEAGVVAALAIPEAEAIELLKTTGAIEERERVAELDPFPQLADGPAGN